MIKESLEVDVKGKTLSYQKPYPISFDTVTYPAGFRLPEFVKFNGDDSKSTFEHVSQYLAQLGKASSINELKVRLFSLSLTSTPRLSLIILAKSFLHSARNFSRLIDEFGCVEVDTICWFDVA